MITIEVRKLDDGSIELFGYANISERSSKILQEKGVRFREQILKGAWSNAISRNKDIKLLVNHNWNKIYGSTSDNLRLHEDNIGARFSIRTNDEDLIKYAENNEFKGLSFAFTSLSDTFEKDGAIQLRKVKDMTINEISLLTIEPAYDGCLVEMRDKDGNIIETRDSGLVLDLSEQEELRQLEEQKELDLKIQLLNLENEL